MNKTEIRWYIKKKAKGEHIRSISFRLSEHHYALLDELSTEFNVSKSEVLRAALVRLYESLHMERDLDPIEEFLQRLDIKVPVERYLPHKAEPILIITLSDGRILHLHYRRRELRVYRKGSSTYHLVEIPPDLPLPPFPDRHFID